jgi:hypothetical protein
VTGVIRPPEVSEVAEREKQALSRHPPCVPVPTHLAGWLGPLDWLDDAGPYLEGDLICPCGAWWFEFLYPGKTHRVEGWPEPAYPCDVEVPGEPNEYNHVFGVDAVCVACRRQVGVIDSKNHGRCWLDVAGSRPRALDRSGSVSWNCSACGSVPHRGRIHYRLLDREHFLEEFARTCGIERWGDGFYWIGFTAIQCYACGHRVKDWAGHECD